MKKNHFSSLVCKLLASLLALLGLNACKSKTALVDENGNTKPRKEGKQEPAKPEKLDPREDVGRMVVLYGGPNMRFQQVEAPTPPSAEPQEPVTE